MIHFFYSVPCSGGGPLRWLERVEWAVLWRAPRFVPTWRFGLVQPGVPVLPSPYSITLRLYRYLAARYPTRLYHLLEPGELHYGPDDVILGHPWPEPGTRFEHAFFSDRPCRLKALIFPIHHRLPEYNRYAECFVERADLVFGIMGQYWWDTLDQSPFRHWRPKLVRLDMAVDARQYPRLKQRFNPPSKRGFLYIGSNRPEKGTNVLAATMHGMPEARCGWIGYGEPIPGLERVASDAVLSPEFMRTVAEEYDIFVNTSVSDANPTTILEAMAWGFPVACTPESGYYRMPSIVELSVDDIEANVSRLRALQAASEAELRALADENRRLVEQEYTWERFCSTVWDHLAPHLRDTG